MNKQLTKKSIGIAASAALMASVAISGNAFAGPPEGKGPPPAKDEACTLSDYSHACIETLKSVDWAIMGADSVNDRDRSTLRNKVCEANFKFEADKLGDAYDKLIDISMTIQGKKKVLQPDRDSISAAAEDAAYEVLSRCNTTY